MRTVLALVVVCTWGWLAAFTAADLGCSPATAGRVARTAVSVGVDLAECAPAEFGAVKDALTLGGASWLSVLVELVHCVPAVVRDIEHATMTADASDQGVVVHGLSKNARRRIRVAKILAPILNH